MKNGLKILFRLSTILFFLALILCFIIDDREGGEFYISVLTAAINLIVAVVSAIIIRIKGKDE